LSEAQGAKRPSEVTKSLSPHSEDKIKKINKLKEKFLDQGKLKISTNF